VLHVEVQLGPRALVGVEPPGDHLLDDVLRQAPDHAAILPPARVGIPAVPRDAHGRLEVAAAGRAARDGRRRGDARAVTPAENDQVLP
jgi:hypothetical protein